MSHDLVAAIRHIGEVAAASVTVLTIFKLLPTVSVVLAVSWYAICLYEKFTGKPFSESRIARFLTGR